MEWRDRGLVLARRPHGESAAIVTLLTAEHGRHGGLLRGGRSIAWVDLGVRVEAEWRGRLPEHLGHWRLEPADAPGGAGAAWSATLRQDRLALAALVAVCALADAAVPEREPHPGLFHATEALFATLAARPPGWPAAVVRWELGLLQVLGYGLALDTCALTGRRDGLTHVSPRTGRAVSAAAAGPWRDRLLPLPPFLHGPDGRRDSPPEPAEILDGLALTGHFLERRLFAGGGREIPAARAAFVERLRRLAGSGAGGEGSAAAGPRDRGPERDI